MRLAKGIFVRLRSSEEVSSRGFTLLELLIVISILAVLAVVLVIVLNPAETLKKSRDVQRMADLSSLKTAIGIYTTSVSPVYLAGASSNAACQADSDGWTGEEATGLIYYSVDATTSNITDSTIDGTTFTSAGNSQVTTAAEVGEVDGTGWLPVNLGAITGGSPLSNFPTDPTNNYGASGGSASGLSSNDLFYRYACNSTNSTFEIDATLESTAYTSTDDKRSKDGGNSTLMYEVGTNLSILGANNATAGNAAAF